MSKNKFSTWIDCEQNNKAIFAMINLKTKIGMNIIDINHYKSIVSFIDNWQKKNRIDDIKESNEKFKVDFKSFFETSNIPESIQSEFLKDIN